MNTRLLALLFLVFTPCMLRAQAAQTRVGDTLELHMTGVPAEDSAQFNGVYTIDDDGMINLPLIQQIKVVGLLPNQIQEEIQNRYVQEKYYIHPTVTVQENATPRYVNVNGNVKAPQRVAYTADMTLTTVITACGGFDDFAYKKKVGLMRDGQVSFYNCEAILSGKAEDPKVLPGDKIIVKPSFW